MLNDQVFYPAKIPLSLYIHLPWCLHKCPYCDFNSHATEANAFPEDRYVSALIQDLQSAQADLNSREVISIFIGGGTPSLFSISAIKNIIAACKTHAQLSDHCEITLEANPGTFEYEKFSGFKEVGINRLSLGVQSFNQKHLKALQRIHNKDEAIQAIETAQNLGFDNINIDLMFGLPEQNLAEANADIRTACAFDVSHISYYQLTLEPNTIFHRFPPTLPNDDICWQIQQDNIQQLHAADYQRYEVSAFAKPNRDCIHNRNYWQFGDYLGLGAGAHSKITDTDRILRFEKPRQPKSYLQSVEQNQQTIHQRALNDNEILFEFLLNNLRLLRGFNRETFEYRTRLSWQNLQVQLAPAIADGMIECKSEQIFPSEKRLSFS